MPKFISTILQPILHGHTPIAPPTDFGFYNHAIIPDGRFRGWKDKDSPYPDIEIPRDSHWLYMVHSITPTSNPQHPLEAGLPLCGPFTSIKDATSAAYWLEKGGVFTCIHGVVVYDNNRLN